MKLSSRAHYAIKTVLELSTNPEQPVTLAYLAQHQNISISYLEQIFAMLRKHNIVKSSRGPGGGYMLKRPLSDITIASIVKAVDKATVKENSMTDEQTSTESHSLWLRLLDLIGDYLAGITLDELHSLYKKQSESPKTGKTGDSQAA